MKSRAHLKSHPIHPILVAFPIAFFSGAFLCDLAFLFINKHSLQIAGAYLVAGGIVGSITAAVPGIIDYRNTVPPRSSAKKRATKHALLNSAVLLIFCIVFYLKRTSEVSLIIILALECIAVALMSVAGWLGGTLVHRNQIGVDIRYANAGKWKEEFFGAKSGVFQVAADGELENDQMKLLHVNDTRIVLARTEGKFVAFDDRCTHRGASLAGGSMICGTVQCPWHGSQFDVCTGAVKAGPAKEALKIYKLRVGEGKIFLDLS